ncbi:8-oxo-dGTP pyrophosphatase MutT (NUDIX family) [Geodermatophilus bullaregiensis]|uniref:NUDIX domain-containing protein n=1 Tax=Geodermatophilus bullaregiensis TaxID=1564160 RepID=UPI0019568EB8|nr:NUDIX domain-containing protein [Geodermatophilus bullaregiensis]MBM7805929.1 8-oxo-dGTP pyrophosphatase MutT (NUDIX family) [Geodermatophilus bullaregiensis]
MTARVHHVVAGVLVRGDRVLLGHRSPARRWYPGVWDLPGGHVEPGEDELTALARELREEVGVVVVQVDADPVARIEDGGLHLALYAVRAWEGEPRTLQPAEHDELRWVTAAEVRGLALADPSYVPLVERVTGAGAPPD